MITQSEIDEAEASAEAQQDIIESAKRRNHEFISFCLSGAGLSPLQPLTPSEKEAVKAIESVPKQSATVARLQQQVEDQRFVIIRALNALDQGAPGLAVEVLRQALGAQP